MHHNSVTGWAMRGMCARLGKGYALPLRAHPPKRQVSPGRIKTHPGWRVCGSGYYSCDYAAQVHQSRQIPPFAGGKHATLWKPYACCAEYPYHQAPIVPPNFGIALRHAAALWVVRIFGFPKVRLNDLPSQSFIFANPTFLLTQKTINKKKCYA